MTAQNDPIRSSHANVTGPLGLFLSLASWLAIVMVSQMSLPDGWGPNVWILSISIGFPLSFGFSLLASKKSKWWYLVCGISLLGIGVLILNLPGMP